MYQSDYRGNSTTDNENTLFSIVPLNACTYRHMSDDSTFHINVNTLEKGLVSKEYPVFVENESDLRFVVQYINSSDSFTKFCTEQKKGGTRTRLYYKTLCEYKMLIPSLNEQHIIADYFDNLDYLITLHQWKHYRIKKIINSAWEQRKLGDICKMNGRIGFRGYTEKDIVAKEAGGVLTFSPTNIVGNQLIVGLNNTYITKEKYEESPEIKVQNGNILFVKTGSTLGKSALVVGIGEDCTVNPQVVVIKVKPDLQKILSVALTSMPIQKQITAVKIGGAVPTMTETELKNIDLILPQRSDERIKIGQYFKNLDHLITLHQQKYKSLKKLKKFMVKNMFLQVKCKNIEKDR